MRHIYSMNLWDLRFIIKPLRYASSVKLNRGYMWYSPITNFLDEPLEAVFAQPVNFHP